MKRVQQIKRGIKTGKKVYSVFKALYFWGGMLCITICLIIVGYAISQIIK